MFTWDPTKNETNIAKHGISFEQAKDVWSLLITATFVANFKDGENRFGKVGEMDGKVWTVFYTERDGQIRIFSARRARTNEERLLK